MYCTHRICVAQFWISLVLPAGSVHPALPLHRTVYGAVWLGSCLVDPAAPLLFIPISRRLYLAIDLCVHIRFQSRTQSGVPRLPAWSGLSQTPGCAVPRPDRRTDAQQCVSGEARDRQSTVAPCFVTRKPTSRQLNTRSIRPGQPKRTEQLADCLYALAAHLPDPN